MNPTHKPLEVRIPSEEILKNLTPLQRLVFEIIKELQND